MNYQILIKEARERAGLTQEQLGEKIGVTGVAIMRYEKGQRKVSIETLSKIANALNIPTSYFLPDGNINKDKQFVNDRLISADKLKQHYAWWGDSDERRTFDQIVDAQPTVDAKPVVRCGECKYYRFDSIFKMYLCQGKFCGHEINANDFCSYGERKEGKK